MSYLLRKINRAKWQATDSTTGDFAADAITICLRTSANTLSFWKLETNSEEEINKVVVAIMSAAENLDTIDVAVINENDIAQHCTILDTPGRTYMHGMEDRHCDLVELTYGKLGKVASLIYDEVINARYKRVTTKNIKKLMTEAIERKEVSLERLHSRLVEDLK